jgi:hypothetical protein
LSLLGILQTAYCGKQNESDGTWEHPLSDFFPRPVKDKETQAATIGANAKWLEYFDAPKEKRDGTSGEAKCNFFTEFFDSLEVGKQIKFQLRQLEHFEKGGDPTKAEPAFHEMGIARRYNLKKKLTNDKSKGRSLIRRAVGLWYVLDDVAAYSDKVQLKLDNDVEIAASSSPFNLIDVDPKTGSPRNAKPMSVTDIMKLDVPLAVVEAGDKGNVWSQLSKQLSRETKETKKVKLTFDNPSDFFNAVAAINNYLDTGSSDGLIHFTAIKTVLARKAEATEQYLEQIASLVDNARALFDDELRAAFVKMRNRQIAHNLEVGPESTHSVKKSA